MKARGELVARLAWLGVAAGALARIYRYLDNRSFWGDEARLALNIFERSPAELLEPLSYAQAAPPGFLLAQKLCYWLLGPSEYALRALPLVAGLAALPLFYSLLRRLVSPGASLLALLLFSLSEPLIYYASELKPYSTDVFFGLWIAAEAVAVYRLGVSRMGVLRLGFAGALGVWMSNPAVFVCAGASLWLGGLWWSGEWSGARRLWTLAAAPLAWAASFLVQLAFVLRHQMGDDYLREFWRDGFAPFPPRSVDDWLWLPQTFLDYFSDPMGFLLAPLAALAFVLGGLALRAQPSRPLLLLWSPFAFALVASALEFFPFRSHNVPGWAAHHYPLIGRLSLFSLPFAIATVACGMAWLSRSGSRARVALGAALTLALVGPEAAELVHKLASPPTVQEMRPLLARLVQRAEASDHVFVQSRSEGVYQYYAGREGLALRASQAGITSDRLRPVFLDALARLEPGDRVWLVTLHHPRWASQHEQELIVEALRAVADPVEALDEVRAQARLFRVRPVAGGGGS